jgi:hypothetical protein
VVPVGFNFPHASPYIVDGTMAPPKREPAKTKAELREMLAEAVRNTQPETKPQTKAKKDRG